MLANGTNANAPKRMPKVSTRAIRISGCHDCVYPEEQTYTGELEMYCMHPDIMAINKYLCVDKYIDTKTLPDNCPLEVEVEVEVEKK